MHSSAQTDPGVCYTAFCLPLFPPQFPQEYCIPVSHPVPDCLCGRHVLFNSCHIPPKKWKNFSKHSASDFSLLNTSRPSLPWDWFIKCTKCSFVVLRMIEVQKMYTFLNSLTNYVAKGSSPSGVSSGRNSGTNVQVKTKIQV